MKLIRDVDPDFLANLDRKSNIIMCVHPQEEESLVESEAFPDTFGITLARDLNLSASNIVKISSSTLSATIRPKIKISCPVGIKLQFNEFMDNHNCDIFWKTYRSFDSHAVHNEHNQIHHNLISNIVFIMYMDTIRMREAGLQMLVKKDTQISNFYFTWYVQTISDMPQIEEIYIIADAQVYEDFDKIF
jgi:hypothetical protein